ncbi:hypothetical protein [Rubinisphaera brasiliensis]|uniref:Uncharacterized protein n=1 Tax=Rubinisphaera brasiliensis (strain ATCC 49424 / DSM 5305 / JCM 21570 / IAM 15109 / NBRC 103401 / IFAM 1448) TaxID=756272 RepID=F0STE7_RUBBR|nr:hypothetical protein [Rubinisphaera brasiliensis]ADY60409.1 hypothetical protein Plabr_2810 [Rubinisphaera brasiliensis DSM 5305]
MTRNSSNQRRRGALLVTALVAIVITSAVIANAVRMVLIAQAEQQRLHARLQLETLVTDALQLEAAKLAHEADANGPAEWTVSPEDWDLPLTGVVVLEKAETDGQTRLIARGRLQLENGDVQQRLTQTYTINPSE